MDYPAIRKSLKAQRQAMGQEARQALSEQACQHFMAWVEHKGKGLFHKTSLNVAGFWPLKYEVDIRPILTACHRFNFKLSLPIVEGSDRPLKFVPWSPDAPMRVAAFGIEEPVSRDQAPLPDLVLVPLLGFSRQGDRLGYGGGFYDRTIAQWHSQGHFPYLMGVGWDGAELPATYQRQEHDERLDAVLTPSGVIYTKDTDFSFENGYRLDESIKQVERGDVVKKTMEELEEMAR